LLYAQIPHLLALRVYELAYLATSSAREVNTARQAEAGRPGVPRDGPSGHVPRAACSRLGPAMGGPADVADVIAYPGLRRRA